MMYSRPLFCFVFLVTYTDVTLTATPTDLIPGTTRTLEIKCSIPKSAIDETGIFNAFIMNHSTDNRTLKTIASYSTKETRNEKGGYMTVSGHVDSKTESFIKLSLKDPKSEDAGSYMCIVNGVTPLGQHATMSRGVTVTLALPKECRSKIKSLEETIAKLENFCSSGEFTKKDRLDNSEYYLSYPTRYLFKEDARTQCERKGGYLVEVDTLKEYNFLVKFLEGENSYYTVLTGATDEYKEDYWIYTRSGKRASDIQWGFKQPDNGRDGNCLHFWSWGNWKMSDEPCLLRSETHLYGYICEVSV